MEQIRTVQFLDTPIKNELEQRREERKQKLFSRLMRNQPNSSSFTSIEAITGVLGYKKPSDSVAVVERNSSLTTQSVHPKIPNQGMKKSLSFRQTATSLRRANLATMGVQTHRSDISKRDTLDSSKKPVATAPVIRKNLGASIPPTNNKKAIPVIPSNSTVLKKSAASVPPRSTIPPRSAVPPRSTIPPRSAIPPRSTTLNKPATGIPPVKQAFLTRKLTLPKSPNFSSRLKERSAAKLPTATTAEKVLPGIPAESATAQTVVRKVLQEKKESGTHTTATWINPLTPEARAPPARVLGAKSAVKTPLSPSTPKVKPFSRKSFTDVKVRPSTSVSFRTGNNESKLSQSMWSIKKEPSEKEKVAVWLEKRGRSIASCRHLSCLGHKLEDFQPQSKSNPRKSIKVVQVTKKKETIPPAPAPLESSNSSLLNTTFEKDDEDKENVQPPPAFNIDGEDSACGVNKAGLEEDGKKELEENEEAEAESADKFHTPELTDEVSDVFTSPSNDHVEKLLKSIFDLSLTVNYSEEKIEEWLKKASDTFPAVKTHPLYWNIKARIAERQGNTYEALDIYNEAVQNKAEPLEMVNDYFNEFLQRVGSSIPQGQRTPLLQSLGVPKPRGSRVNTPRRPLLDSSKAFDSSVIKYEVKLKKIFQAMQDDLKVNATPSRRSVRIGTTPMKVNTNSHLVSVTNDETCQLVATPVRRSMRPTSMRSLGKVHESDRFLYVDDLDQLSPTTKAKVELRTNSALHSE